ncbi:hypothetical protein H257_12755 [Aphanomyces astaci]|uniref:Uncharacterized protein n=1 Tax=Aphanomyces astaci TaxID=112090 RepID=W4FZ10_APHAT|nr:hypothetical protein H257_12755 [Aphanomyces astaci]ETV71918.1 hypothetical protein H257_12755 [Aphanomyces astaci]|eukprot:XP_009838361.1 hypothetical protein H257_12755 [Aphanomyces astaci]
MTGFMLKLRDDERAVTCTHLVNYLKRNYREWLAEYLQDKRCGYKTHLRLLQTFCARHGFTRQRLTKSKKR